jgi:hypothetical protein
MSILYVGCMKFLTNRFVENFIQLTYKIDMCKRYICNFLIASIKKYVFLTYLKDICNFLETKFYEF